MSNSLKSGLVLLVLGVICGTLLAVVNSFTAPEILRIENEAKATALAEFYTISDYDLTILEDLEGNVQTIYILKEKDTENIEALVYQVISNSGHNGPITMLIAVNSDYTVEGYTVINHSEDAGFGADIMENDFGITTVTNLMTFDSVAGSTHTSDGIYECFEFVALRAGSDFGGGLDE